MRPGLQAGITSQAGTGAEDIKGCGTSGMAALDPATGYVIKFHLGTMTRDNGARRRERSMSSCRCRSTDHGILLEYAEHGPVREYLRKSPEPIAKSTLIKWATQGWRLCKSEDLLNLDAALYEMERGHLLFPDLEEDEREERLEAGEFPDLSGLVLKSVILRLLVDDRIL
ncbi:hypothetical protein BDW69DRAFT_198515 [Aspergillus filifer]